MTEHDLPRPRLVHEHVEHYLWMLMCLIQDTDAPTGWPTQSLMDLWTDTHAYACSWVQDSVAENYIIRLENTQ